MANLYFRYGAMGSSKTANALMVAYNLQLWRTRQESAACKTSDRHERGGCNA